MKLSEKQRLFARLIAHFISHIFAKGWAVTLGDGHVEGKVGHMKNSLHYVRLAQDLNLFVDGEYISDGDHPAWKEIGEFWEGLHPLCAWGGRFRDANHFSLEHEGRK
jgi:hypothetical protein